MDLQSLDPFLFLGFRFMFQNFIPHKNKEIKRMLSKKMTVSLMSLIIIFALAFVFVVPSDAQTFSTTITRDSANVTQAAGGGDLDIDIVFGAAVSLADVQAATFTVTVVYADFTTGTSAVTGAAAVAFVGGAAGGTAGPVAQKDINPALLGLQSDGRSFTLPINAAALPNDATAPGAAATTVHVSIYAGTAATAALPAIPSLDPANDDVHAAATLTVNLRDDVLGAHGTSNPMVVSIQRLRPGTQTVEAAFQEAAVTGPFEVRIVLTEQPHTFNLTYINVANGTASNFIVGAPFPRVGTAFAAAAPTRAELLHTVVPHPTEGKYAHDGLTALLDVPTGEDMTPVPPPTGPTGMYYQYRATITPHRRADNVAISVNSFRDSATPPNFYYPDQVDLKPNGREQLRLDVNIPAFNQVAGYNLTLPHGNGAQITYANGMPGHLILTTNKDGSHIRYFGEDGVENDPVDQTHAQLLYNVRQLDLPNLETFLANHGTIHLVSYGGHAAGSAYISEVMWGTDASQEPVNNSNWIEIRNGTTAAIGIAENIWKLWFYEAHETPPTVYPANSAYEGPTGQAGTIVDIIGTKDGTTGLSWSIAGKGQSGRSNIDIARTVQHVLTPTTPLKSMYRMMVPDTTAGAAAGAMMPGDGTMEGNWMQTAPPSVNLAVGRENAIVATPGAAPFETPDDVAAAEAAAAATAAAAAAAAAETAGTGTIPQAGSIYISEIMFDGGGQLPQWIEISNGSTTEDVNLSGWTLTINNAAADADVSIGASATFTIPDGTMINRARQTSSPSTILVVTEAGRNNIDTVSDQVIVLNAAGSSTEVELILAGVTKRKYTLLSSDAFLITLAPEVKPATKLAATATAAEKAAARSADAKDAAMRKEATDMVGNLGADGTAAWALPTSDEGRSSIIRKHIKVRVGPSEPEDGMMAGNWMLASDTSFADATHIRTQTYYGAMSDVGTPGFRAGGALPVELSSFRPARQKETGQVVITWSTQSELNNAGFFIKRSQQRDGEFKAINATMIPGAGTTSEKQFYTYTDTTAQPNVVYYYQIEDVSLDGNRQTLTRGIRLKGHIGAAGKLTSTWGELKTSNE